MTGAQIMTGSAGKGTTARVQEEIIQAAQRSFERLPLFEVLMARVVQALGPALRAALSVQADVTLQGVEYMACGDAMAAAPDPGLIAVAAASPWDGSVAVTIDPDLLFATLEIMLGASDREEPAPALQDPPRPAWSPRPFTTIEKRLGAQLVGLALREVAAAFAPLDIVSFKAGAIESGPRDVLFSPPAAGCARVTIRITLDGRGGDLCLIMPHRTLDAVRPLLARPGVADQLGGDPGWRAQLEHSLNQTPVTLTAVLHERAMPLADVLGWVPGQVLSLGIDTAHEVTVTSGGRDMFRAAIGRRRNGSVALRVTTVCGQTEEEAAHGPAD
jgi:flagellar motor switch protein FliM